MAAYEIEFTTGALRDLKRLSPDVAARIVKKVTRLTDSLSGDVKRLVEHSPGFRLRVGDWRVLFDVDGSRVLIQHVSHRSRAYNG